MLLQFLGMIHTIGNIVLIDTEVGIALTAQITTINLTHFRIYHLPTSSKKTSLHDFYIRSPCFYPNNFYLNNNHQKHILATTISPSQTEFLILCNTNDNSSSSNFLYEIVYYQENGTVSFPRQSYLGGIVQLIHQENDLVLFKMENGDLFMSHRAKNSGFFVPIVEGASQGNSNRVYLNQNIVYIITQNLINSIIQSSTLKYLTLENNHPTITNTLILPTSKIHFLFFFHSTPLLITENQDHRFFLHVLGSQKHQQISLQDSVDRLEVFSTCLILFLNDYERWEVYEENIKGEIVMKEYYYPRERYRMHARVQVRGEEYLLCEKQGDNGESELSLHLIGQISKEIVVQTQEAFTIDFLTEENSKMVSILRENRIASLKFSDPPSKITPSAPILTSSMVALIIVFVAFILSLFIIYFGYKCYTRRNQRIANRISQFSQQTIIFEEDPTQICPICLQPVCLARIPCGHYFHPQCINQWLKRRQYCPMCRNLTNHKDIGSVLYP